MTCTDFDVDPAFRVDAVVCARVSVEDVCVLPIFSWCVANAAGQ